MALSGGSPKVVVASAASSAGVVLAAISISLALSGFSQVTSLPEGITGPTGPVTLAIGPQGGTITPELSDEGTIGPVGLLGSRGPMGPVGPQGISGFNGVSGLAGAHGEIGPVGPMGSAGINGAKGANGAIGLSGIPGLQGLAGLLGATGPQGIQGIQGPMGPIGLTGPKGDTGAQGPQGPQGPQGEPGAGGIAVRYEVDFRADGLSFSGTPATGSYIRNGDLVTFRIYLDLSTVEKFGTGNYTLSLPFSPAQNYVFRDGAIHDNAKERHFQMYGDAEVKSINLSLMYSEGSQDLFMNSLSPLELDTRDFMYISGTYEVAP